MGNSDPADTPVPWTQEGAVSHIRTGYVVSAGVYGHGTACVWQNFQVRNFADGNVAAVNADETYTVQAQTKVPRSAANPDGWQKVRVTKVAGELTAGIANRGLTNAERKSLDENKRRWSKAISNTSDDTLNALDEIASGKDFGIIHNKEYGNIRYNHRKHRQGRDGSCPHCRKPDVKRR